MVLAYLFKSHFLGVAGFIEIAPAVTKRALLTVDNDDERHVIAIAHKKNLIGIKFRFIGL
jgi:hypothetical protein